MNKLLPLLLFISCGQIVECLNREQVLALCLSDKIKADDRRWKVPYFRDQCERDFPYEQCYPKNDYIK